MRGCGIGDYIEFKPKAEGDLYVDVVNEIQIFEDGREVFWTFLWPESPGGAGVPDEWVTRIIESAKWERPQIPAFPFRKGQRIQFKWDKDKHGNDTYYREVITEAYCVIGDSRQALFRFLAGGFEVCLEDDDEIELVSVGDSK